MKRIQLKEAYEILQNASAVIIDDLALAYPALSELQGEAENEFLFVTWEDGEEYYLRFTEGGNVSVRVVGDSLFLYNTEAESDGDFTKLTILRTVNLEETNAAEN